MFKELIKQQPPLVIKGNFSDPYLMSIVVSYLRSMYSLVEVNPANFHDLSMFTTVPLYTPKKPQVLFYNSLQFPDLDVKRLTDLNVIILVNFNRTLNLGLPEILIGRLSGTKKALGFVREYIKYYLKSDAEISHETWVEIARPNFSVLRDIEKTILAYGSITTETFNSTTVTSPASIQIVELLSQVYKNSFDGSLRALEAAWDSGVSLENALYWFGTRLENYLAAYRKGLSVEDALIEAEISGNLRKLFNLISMQPLNDVVSSIWRSLSLTDRFDGKAKDIMLLLYLFNRVS